MNTNPDDELLVRWLDDDLSAAESITAEARFAGDPALLALRADSRRWRGEIARALPRSEEPPHAEFFNARIARAIRMPEEIPANPEIPASRPAASSAFGGRALWMPLAACAGMVFSFWIGLKQGNSASPAAKADSLMAATSSPRGLPLEPAVYTPVRGVDAEWFESDSAGATVIVLTGVPAIPDNIDLFSARLPDSGRASERTAHRNHSSAPGRPHLR